MRHAGSESTSTKQRSELYESSIDLHQSTIARTDSTPKVVLSLRSRRKHKAWGVSPRIKAQRIFEPANAGDRPTRRRIGDVLSPISWARNSVCFCSPGAYAPGFMLPPASQA